MSNEQLIMEGTPPPMNAQHHPNSDYDRLRNQCFSAVRELKMFSNKHAETLTRLEKVTHDREFYKQQSLGIQKKLDDLQNEHDQVIYDRNKLRQDYEDIVLLREQEMSGMYKCSVCYANERAAALPQSVSKESGAKVKLLEEEILNLTEKNSKLTNNLTSAIQGFEKALIDRGKSDHEFKMLKGQHEQMSLDLQDSRKTIIELRQIVKKTQEENHRVHNELKLVMSERATVHQEIQELQDNLGQTKDKARKLNKDKEEAFLEKEGFQREIQSVLADRDQARRENRKLQARLDRVDEEREKLSRKCESQARDIEMFRQAKDAAQKERNEAIVHRDKILKECFEVKRSFEELGGGHSEQADKLKEKFIKLSGELTSAWKQTDVALTRRNWAFNERDKKLKDLEQLKEKYNNLEKEKMLLDEKLRKFKDLKRENVQLRTTLLHKGSALQSQDSAIGTESPSYQICQIDLIKTSAENEFGFKIKSKPILGSENRKNDISIVVSDVTPGSIASNNNLKISDCILMVNDIDMTNTDFLTAHDTIFNSIDHIRMRILRFNKLGSKSPLQRLEIKGGEEKNIGLSIDSGLYIKRIEPGSAAAEEETISIGDKILTINGFSSENMSYDEAKKMLKTSHLSLTLLKPSVSTTSSHRSLLHHERTDEKNADHTESDSMTSGEGLISAATAVSFSHVRSPSAPIHIGSPEFLLQHGGYSHVKSMSIINKLSDDEIKKVLVDLSEEQKRREQLEMIDEGGKPSRSPSFITAIRKTGHFASSTEYSPYQASTNSINSSGSAGRHDLISSPMLNIAASDPLSLDLVRTIGQPSSATTSNTSLSSMHQKRLKPAHPGRYTARPYEHHTWTGPPPPKLSSKLGSRGSVGGPFSNSSHGSLNSDISESHGLPVYHEEKPLTMAIDEHPVFIGSRRSGRSSESSKPELASLPSSRKNSKRSECKTPSGEEKTRLITIERGQNPLGIQIKEGNPNGIFVSHVTEGSHASKFGLKYGDQLLEFNGINLRTADYRQAETILRSANENTVTVLVHYNPDKIPEENPLSAQSTPCTPRKSIISSPSACKRGGRLSGAGNFSTPGTPVSAHIRLSSNTSSSSGHSKFFYAESKITPIPENDDVGEPRLIHINREPSSLALGLSIIGGNDTGIFISNVQKGSLASQSGLRCGDKILMYNDKDMRRCTLEEATLELGKHTEIADIQVQYHPPGYRKAKTHSNDSFYVRAQFDRISHNKGDLGFKKGDILHVTETLYKGQLGVWNASIVLESETKSPNTKLTKGKIPSKRNAEQELLLRRSSSYGDDKSKSRKSIFRRSKKSSSHYAITHSRESSDSKADVESTVSGGTSFVFVADDYNTYQYVKQLESTFLRPVVIVGAMAEPICDKLVIDFVKNFSRCFEVVHMEQDQILENIENGKYLDYKQRGDRYEVIATEAVKEFPYKQPKHCLLDVSLDAIERISSNQLYPIVVYVKYKSGKVIRDLRDDHYIKEKLSSREAKDLHEVYNKMEKEYKHLFNVTINCTNLTQICKDINDAVAEQQNKVLWVIDE